MRIDHNNDDNCGLTFPGTRKWTLKHNEKHILHRIGGYAIIHSNGTKEYWVYGNNVSRQHHDMLHNLIKLKGLI